MNLDKHFGDAYDIVKRSLLGWLGGLGAWSAHPMFTDDVTEDAANAFGRLLGVRILSRERLDAETDRESYLAVCNNSSSHVFLDPDTGLKLGSGNSPEYLFGNEVVRLVEARPAFLTMTFDQSLQRGNEMSQARAKLKHFAGRGISGMAYVAQVGFLVFGRDNSLVEQARRVLAEHSELPEDRFILATPSNLALHPAAASQEQRRGCG